MFTVEQKREYYRTLAAEKREAKNRELAELNSRRSGWTRETYAEFLIQYYWEVVFTATFKKPRREPYYAAMSVWNEFQRHFANRAFIGVEPHQSGDLHLHGLVAGNIKGWLPEMELLFDIKQSLDTKFGWSVLSEPNSIDGVSSYCAKHILKRQSSVGDFYYILGESWAWRNGQIN